MTPPAPVAPTLSNLTHLQGEGGVLAGNSYTVCVDVSGQSGHNVTVTFGAGKGSFSGGPFSTTSGSGHFCATYTAPGETGSDSYTATATDTATGASSSLSWSFNVSPQPASP